MPGDSTLIAAAAAANWAAWSTGIRFHSPTSSAAANTSPAPVGSTSTPRDSRDFRGRAPRTAEHRPAPAPGYRDDGDREVLSFGELRFGDRHDVESGEPLEDFRRPTNRNAPRGVPAAEEALGSGSREDARAARPGQGARARKFIGDRAVEDRGPGRKVLDGATDVRFRDGRCPAEDRLFPRTVFPVAGFRTGCDPVRALGGSRFRRTCPRRETPRRWP